MTTGRILLAAALGIALAFTLRVTPFDSALMLPYALAPVYFGGAALAGILGAIVVNRGFGALLAVFGIAFGLAALAIVVLLGG